MWYVSAADFHQFLLSSLFKLHVNGSFPHILFYPTQNAASAATATAAASGDAAAAAAAAAATDGDTHTTYHEYYDRNGECAPETIREYPRHDHDRDTGDYHNGGLLGGLLGFLLGGSYD